MTRSLLRLTWFHEQHMKSLYFTHDFPSNIAPLPRLSCTHRRSTPSCWRRDERIGDNERSCCQQSNARQPSHGEQNYKKLAQQGGTVAKCPCGLAGTPKTASILGKCPPSAETHTTGRQTSEKEDALPHCQRIAAGEYPLAGARWFPLCMGQYTHILHASITSFSFEFFSR